MKICFISTMPAHRWGGSEELLAATVRAALEQGDAVLLSVSGNKPVHKEIALLEKKGAIISFRGESDPADFFFKVSYKLKRMLKGLADVPAYYNALLEEIAAFNPEFIFVNQGGVFNVVEYKEILWMLKTLKKPFYLLGQTNEEHKTYAHSYVQRIRAVYAEASRIYFISERNLAVTKRQIAAPWFNNYEVVQNPCRVNLQQPLPYPESKEMHFALVGRVECRCKGQDLLFNILAEEKWKNRDWFLNIYGDGPDVEYLKELAGYYRIEQRVAFKGFAEDVLSIWKQNHIAVMPSLNEGMPLSLMEAMMCGRTAVVTDVGDNATLIQEGKTGFVAPAATVQLFAEALERAWQVNEQWEKLGIEAHLFAKKHFDAAPGKTLLESIKKDLGSK